jgi:hypothetical protein
MQHSGSCGEILIPSMPSAVRGIQVGQQEPECGRKTGRTNVAEGYRLVP